MRAARGAAAALALGLLARPLDQWLPAPVLFEQAAKAYSFWFFPATEFNKSLGAKVSLGLAWTLKYEWLFYASLPFLALVRARRWWWLLLPLAAPADHFVFHQGWVNFFIFGAAACELTRLPQVQRFARSTWAAAGSMVLVVGVAYFVDVADLANVGPALLLSIAFLAIVGGSDWFGIPSQHPGRDAGGLRAAARQSPPVAGAAAGARHDVRRGGAGPGQPGDLSIRGATVPARFDSIDDAGPPMPIGLAARGVTTPGGRGTRSIVLGLPTGGEGGIRTRGGCLALTRFPGVRLKPLIHLSGRRNLSGSRRDPSLRSG